MRQMMTLVFLKGLAACRAGLSCLDSSGAWELADIPKDIALDVEESRCVQRKRG